MAATSGNAPNDADDGSPKLDLPLDVVDRRAEPSAATPSYFRKARKPLAVLAVMFLGAVIGMYFQPPGLQLFFWATGLEPGAGSSRPIAVPAGGSRIQSPPQSDAQSQRIVAGLGAIEPAGEVSVIAPPFGAGDARIAALSIEEGDIVSAGQIIARLDNAAPLEAARDRAKAALRLSEANLAQAKDRVLRSRQEAEAALERARATALNAARAFDRSEALTRRGVTSDAALDQARAARDEAERRVDEAEATLARFAGAPLDKQVDVVVAERQVEAAEADLSAARADLEKSLVRAPIDGAILAVFAHPGEKPGGDGVARIADLSRMVAKVEIFQSDIGLISLGDRAEIEADALPRPLTGRVSKIGLEVLRQTRVGEDPAANTDARVVETTVALDAESSALAARFTNLQVIARIDVAAGSADRSTGRSE